MKGQWRVVYRFVFAHGTGKWRSRSFDTEQAANTFVDEAKAIAGKNVECRVQPATFRMPRNIGITYDGKIMKRNPVMKNPSAREKAQFMDYLETTIIPDSREAGRTETADDLATMLHILQTGKPTNGWRTVTEFVNFLRTILIPDLRKSGSDGYVKDFQTGLKFIRPTKADAKTRREELYGPDRLRRNPVRKFSRRKKRVAAKNAFAPFGYYPKRSYLQAATRVRKPMKQNSVLDSLSEGQMKTNPHKRSSKKPLSAKQKAAREKFVKMVRSGAFKKRGRNAPKRDPFGGAVRNPRKLHPRSIRNFKPGGEYNFSRTKMKRVLTRAKRKKLAENILRSAARMGPVEARDKKAVRAFARHLGGSTRRRYMAMRKNPKRKTKIAKFILCLPRIGDSRMWYYGAKANQVTTVKADAKVFRTEMGALSEARAHKFRLAKHGFFEARTQRI